MWETMKNSEVCAFFEGELLTVIDKEGKVRFADWTGRDRRSVPEPERTDPELPLKRVVHEAVPVGDEVWVLTANPHQGASGGQMQLVRLDRELKELDRQDLHPLDEHLDYVYTGLYRNYTPHHLLTPTHYFRIGFLPRAMVGTCPGWKLENGVSSLYLFWKDLPGVTWEEWTLDVSDITGTLPGGGEDSLDSFQDIEVMLARGNRLWILAELNLHPWGYCRALLEADVEEHTCRILWASDKNDPHSYGGEPRILDLERGIQWTFAHRGEAGRPQQEDVIARWLPLVPRRLEPDAPILEGEPVWQEFPIAWPEDLLAWNGMVWMQHRGTNFYGLSRTGEPTEKWFVGDGEDAPAWSSAVCEGLWQGQLIFHFDDGRLAAVPAQLEEPAPDAVRWLRGPSA